jgi:hypothetical protein
MCKSALPKQAESARKVQQINVGIWNVRTMWQKGKLENIKREMKRGGVNVLGISETRWEGVGEFRSDEYRIIYSGAKRGQRGVALILDKEVSERVSYICQLSDRILVVRIAAEPVDVYKCICLRQMQMMRR